MKYEVIRPWFGVKLGDVVELKQLHPALKANVRPLKGHAAMIDATDSEGVKLIPATPTAQSGDRKGIIAKRLKELDIEFNGRLGADKLAELMPDDELKALFPDE